MTWWFHVLVAFTLATLAWSFYKYRLNRALELMTIRNRIASDLHDEIGSNLSNISIFSNVAQHHKPGSPQVDSMLGKISEYTQTSMDAMNDIVWMINSRNDRFENIMVRMRTLASEIFEATNTNLHIDFNERLNNVKLNMQERKNFYLVFKEAINNIAKYAGCSDVWIEMTLKNKHVILSIRDNGKGFDLQAARKGNGLINMKTRAGQLKGSLDITSFPGKGTEMRFSFPV
jgi:signal transduction histidine kinase